MNTDLPKTISPPAADPTSQESPVQHVMQSQQMGPPEVTKLKFYQAGKTIGNGWGFKTPSGSVDGFDTEEAAQRIADIQKDQDRKEADTGTGPIAEVLRKHFTSARPTPRTDEDFPSLKDAPDSTAVWVEIGRIRSLERELAEAREHLKNANRGAERNMHMTRFAHERLEKAEQDRDRLAEALKQIEEWSKNGPTIVRDIANSALAAVKGGDQ